MRTVMQELSRGFAIVDELFRNNDSHETDVYKELQIPTDKSLVGWLRQCHQRNCVWRRSNAHARQCPVVPLLLRVTR